MARKIRLQTLGPLGLSLALGCATTSPPGANCPEPAATANEPGGGGSQTKVPMAADLPIPKGAVESISTPNRVNTSAGVLEFFDGVPSAETTQKLYDYLDTYRTADVFLRAMPAASVKALIDAPLQLGGGAVNQFLITDKLMDSQPLFLTANTSTLYVMAVLDLKRDGPTVLEIPPGMLGAINDAWFRYVGDIGPFGPDKGKGGRFLVLPPDYEGKAPSGYFVVKSRSYKNWVFMRASIAEGVPTAVELVTKNLKAYPLSQKAKPPKMEFISGSGKEFNTIHPNTATFYAHVNEVIQYEPWDVIDAETRGLLAAVGIEKGKPFAPNARMQRILKDGVAIGNGIARSIVWYPRTDGTLAGIEVYPGSNSAWIMGWVDKNVFFNGKDKKTMNSDARVMFHYPYTAVTPAMAVSIPGKGSDYAIAYVDADKKPFDGSKTYRLHLPPNVPVNDFWAVTLYDTQTRSELRTSQTFPTVGSQSDGIKKNEDGSYDIYFAPKPPAGFEKNWLATVPGKSWFLALRMYGPLEPWLAKKWRPSEVELVH